MTQGKMVPNRPFAVHPIALQFFSMRAIFISVEDKYRRVHVCLDPVAIERLVGLRMDRPSVALALDAIAPAFHVHDRNGLIVEDSDDNRRLFVE
jgi:hypothetical protein